jgi:hypothetical protein
MARSRRRKRGIEALAALVLGIEHPNAVLSPIQHVVSLGLKPTQVL